MTSNQRRPGWMIAVLCLGLALIVWLVFGQALTHSFINFDDESYVYANPVVSRGLTPESIGWAFTHVVSHNWHPLTTISHMLDCELFDLKPGGHHFTNVVLHTIATVLLFLVLYQMTRGLWRSAFVAAVFAIHPLHVESVAWIAERKDVLSAVFFMLTIGTYQYYVQRPNAVRYTLLSIVFALGLISKPMLVTVPLVLLVIDYWPLDRFRTKDASIGQLVLEKIPLLLLALPVGITTALIQRHGIDSIRNVSLPWRLGNAFVSLAIYLRELVWSFNLAPFYPHLGNKIPLWQIAIAIVVVVGLTAIAIIVREKRPWYLAGWLWYTIMLLPVVGIIQVGDQAHADRYSYLPQIGLYVAIAWGITDLLRQWRHRHAILGVGAACSICLLAWEAFVQTSYWRDSVSLWTHTLDVAESDLAHERLASALLDADRQDDAIVQAQLAINLDPRNASAENDFGVALARRGQPDVALQHFWKALEANPNLSRLQYNIANAFAAKGDTEQAKMYYENQLRIDPNFAEAHNNLASLFLHQGRFVEATDHLNTALRLKPNYAEAHNNIAVVFSQEGRMQDAIEEWKKTLSIEPNNLDAHSNLAWVLATSPSSAIRNGPMAFEHAERALQLSKESNPRIWRLLAAANAEMGRFDAAIEAAEHALRLAQTQNNAPLVQTLESNIALFKNSSPLRDYQPGPR